MAATRELDTELEQRHRTEQTARAALFSGWVDVSKDGFGNRPIYSLEVTGPSRTACCLHDLDMGDWQQQHSPCRPNSLCGSRRFPALYGDFHFTSGPALLVLHKSQDVSINRLGVQQRTQPRQI